tara:strand:+ start:604 stop:1029 length:426 start_codon:yes stop_codon:yes gene_type:complete
MLGKKVKYRILILTISTFFVFFLIFLTLKSLEKNVVYFFSPTEIYNDEDINLDKKIRVGGLVKEGSIINEKSSYKFIITDLKNEIIVSYSGLLPNLFSEGKGVVAEGKLSDKKFFVAETILAKHDENYMPPEVSKAIENSN